MKDLVPEPPKGVHTSLYADDIALWCTAEYATTANYRMQIALDKVVTWAERWCVKNNWNSLHTLSKNPTWQTNL
jgi:hypothetical protein